MKPQVINGCAARDSNPNPRIKSPLLSSILLFELLPKYARLEARAILDEPGLTRPTCQVTGVKHHRPFRR
jgi:hypothetical protein